MLVSGIHFPTVGAAPSPALGGDVQQSVVDTPTATIVGLHVVPISGPLGLADVRIQWATTDPTSYVSQGRLILSLAHPNSDRKIGQVPLSPNGSTRICLSLFSNWSPSQPIRAWVDQSTTDASKPPVRSGPFDFQLATAPHIHTPDWAKGIVWYQILPDRFNSGDPANDPHGPNIWNMKWSGDWSRPSVAEHEDAWHARLAGRRASRRESSHGLLSVVFRRRYGGDLPGVVDRLDHLQSLGVGAVYLCPIFEAPSLHKYDARDHRHIDPTLTPAANEPGAPVDQSADPADASRWTWTPADLYFVEHFLPALHARRMRIVLDGVWNHVGREHWAFRDVLAHGRASRFAPWFRLTFQSDAADSPIASYGAWDGRNGTLPNFAQTPAGNLVEPVKAHIFDITRRWMTPAPTDSAHRGIDGWRLDVAPEIGLGFWRDWNTLVKQLNPDAITIAEVWHAAPDFTTPSAIAPSTTPTKAFDAQMNYPFARAVVAWLQNPTTHDSVQLARTLTDLLSQHPATNLVQMNLLGSHDTQRLASALANPDAPYDSGGQMGRGQPPYHRGKPPPDAYARARLAMILQATWEGAPMICFGDEFGVHGAKDPDNRKPVPWPDLAPFDNHEDAPDEALVADYRRWFTLRQDPDIGPTLRLGNTQTIATARPDVFAFVRALNGARVVIVINAGTDPFDASGILSNESADALPDFRRRLDAGAGTDQTVAGRTAGLWHASPSPENSIK